MDIDLNISPETYKEIYNRISRSNLLQDISYGLVMSRLYHFNQRFGVISIDGKQVGIFQMLERKLFGGAFHAVVLDRVPLWTDNYYCEEKNILQFFKQLSEIFPKRIGRVRRIIPEARYDSDGTDNEELKKNLSKIGYSVKSGFSYSTSFLPIYMNPDEIRKNMHQKWRNVLSKSEKQGLIVEINENSDYFPEIINKCSKNSKEKGYKGGGEVFLKRLAIEFVKEKRLITAVAFRNIKDKSEGRFCSAVMIFRHGKSATYQLAWNDDFGKKSGANNLLLWHIILTLKNYNCEYLDLGGFYEKDMSGLRKYKSGLGGVEIHFPFVYS